MALQSQQRAVHVEASRLNILRSKWYTAKLSDVQASWQTGLEVMLDSVNLQFLSLDVCNLTKVQLTILLTLLRMRME